MSCNCPDTNKCPTPTTCLCGFETNIYNPSGVLVETVTAYPIDVEGTTMYQVLNSTAFESTLGQTYTLTIAYNYELERWEMTYFNNELELTILLGVLYGVDADSCPISNCWDLDCIAVAWNNLGVFTTYFPWTGEYTNGKKSYTFDFNFVPYTTLKLYWTPDSSTIPGSGAPVGTPAWVLEGSTIPGVYEPISFYFSSNNCPYGPYIFEFDNPISRMDFEDLGVTGFDLKTTILDCGCCDTEVTIDLDGEEYTATVQYDEYGNVLVYGGINYYTFTIGENTYYIFYLNGQWVLKGALSISGPTFANLTSNNECPYGLYNSELFDFVFVKGVKCFDCCDYDTPKNRNLLKKKKAIFVDEISSIRSREIFGFKCGPEWDDLFKKHLIFDVLWCLPYGKICDEEQQCLINNLNENCNC
jgi:hypothetical protein